MNDTYTNKDWITEHHNTTTKQKTIKPGTTALDMVESTKCKAVKEMLIAAGAVRGTELPKAEL